MCLAIPGKVIEIREDAAGVRMGKTDFGGIMKQVCLEYTPEVHLGDYILVHVGFALSKVDEAEARRTYAALDELNQLTELQVQTELTASTGIPGTGSDGIPAVGGTPKEAW
jgi:hydrogenase expression/formation protein HypC